MILLQLQDFTTTAGYYYDYRIQLQLQDTTTTTSY